MELDCAFEDDSGVWCSLLLVNRLELTPGKELSATLFEDVAGLRKLHEERAMAKREAKKNLVFFIMFS